MITRIDDKMSISTFSLLVAVLAVLAISVAADTYPSKFDDIDPNEILNNADLRNEYYNCLMDTGPCKTEAQQFFKEVAAEVFMTKCAKCTEKQKKTFDMVISWYTTNSPDEWNAAVKKILKDGKKN